MELHKAPMGQEAAPEETQHEEPETMEALLAQEGLVMDFPKRGEIREGVISAITDTEVLVNVGAKSEGVVPKHEFDDLEPEERERILREGERIRVYVTGIGPNSTPRLSFRQALELEDWERAEAMRRSKEIFQGTITGYNKGGLEVRVGRLRGFIPLSQISRERRASLPSERPDASWKALIGQPIVARIIEVDPERRRLILSERAAAREARELAKERVIEELQVGEVRTGRVTSLTNFGAFVNIDGADGLVHLSEISWEHIDKPSDVLKVGQEVQVKIISIDRENKRIGLSIRQLQEDPWQVKVRELREGQLVRATITRLAKFGAFARLENGLEGLIHISELSTQHVEHPKEVVKEGEELTLRIIKIDPEQRRIGLSLKAVDSLAYADLDLQMAIAEAEAEAKQAKGDAAPAEAEGEPPIEAKASTAPPEEDDEAAPPEAAEEATE